ncbi:Crp/Fnr family transcriptional regulator [Aestuariispira ectoiniformans]|uniref:Crp/Fnr family transcriptional regulator n=1 Tax=Aestuariispira ectoiniformans TaxID=2775080 RepID=UPI00223AAA65|nr:Crp/Fnr family transcriptional regulator [Aestuariispira ectoiniformans]
MTAAPEHSLAGIHLLQGVDRDTVSAFEERCGWRTYTANEQIIDRQSDSRDVFFVTRGKARVVNYSMSGREIAFDDIAAGAFFGELAALDGQPRSANVVTLEPTTVATLSDVAFQELLCDHPEVALVLMRRMARIIRTSVDRIMDLSTLGANNRVQAEILRLARRESGDEGNSATINPVPVHNDLASRVSTTRETVARVFGDLTKKGILERKGNKLIVTDVGRLQGMVEQFRGD